MNGPIIDGQTGKLIEPAPAAVATAQPLDPVAPSHLRKRLKILYAGLGLLLVAGVAGLVFAIASDSSPGSTGASIEGAPLASGSPYGRLQALAQEVGAKYTFDNGKPIDGVLAGPPLITSNQPEGSTQILLSAIAVTPDLPAGGASGRRDIVFTKVNGESSVQYVLCGFGNSCAIATGKPSIERHTLLRREALELALRTFRAISGIDSVSVFLPPRPDAGSGGPAPTMVFLRRQDVEAELQRPIETTLSPKTPGIGKIETNELDRVNRLTQKHLYQYNYTQAQDGSAVMLLDPVVT